MKEQETIDTLERLGFKTASEKVKRLAEKKRKLAIAYEHYRFVRQEKIDDFNQKLKEKTIKISMKYGFKQENFQILSFTSIEKYYEVPPDSVLMELEIAMERKCFDSYEIAHIVDVVKVPDPILFGRVEGCPDRFFIDQWDNDVSIEEILKPNEG